MMLLGDVLPPANNKGGGLPIFWPFHTGESPVILVISLQLVKMMKWCPLLLVNFKLAVIMKNSIR